MTDLLAQAIIAGTAENHTMVAEVLPPVPNRLLHVDGDFMAYWVGVIDDPGTGRAVAVNKIEKAMQLSRAERAVVHMTDEASSKADRRIIAEVLPYQANRKGGSKPINWQAMRDFLINIQHDRVSPKNWSTREADDGMAWAAHRKSDACPDVIMSKDKDMRMLPGVHISWDDFSLTNVPFGAYDVVGTDGKQYGLKWFWLQMLHGDKADNIPGLPKYINDKGKPALCGDATAGKLLAGVHDSGSACEAVSQHYENYYGGEWRLRMAEQALLLWLRTDREASVYNVLNVLGPSFDPAVYYYDKKIQEAYAQAESLGSTGPASDDAG
jgi:hypothetical protein